MLTNLWCDSHSRFGNYNKLRREKTMTINRFKKTTVSVLVALSLGATGAIANDQISKPAGAKGTGTAKAFQAKNNKFWILFGLTIILSLSSQLFGQVNRVLNISPLNIFSNIFGYLI